jgi:hypothetical protein
VPRQNLEGFAMSMSEWTEFETISRKIAHAEERLSAARSTRNYGLIPVLEREIVAAGDRRDRVMSQIAASLTSSSQSSPLRDPSRNNSASSQPAPDLNKRTGVDVVWKELTRSDIDRVKRALHARRSEMLALHAEELKAIEAEAAEIDVLERAIEALVRKLNIGGAEVVPLERAPLSQAS